MWRVLSTARSRRIPLSSIRYGGSASPACDSAFRPRLVSVSTPCSSSSGAGVCLLGSTRVRLLVAREGRGIGSAMQRGRGMLVSLLPYTVSKRVAGASRSCDLSVSHRFGSGWLVVQERAFPILVTSCVVFHALFRKGTCPLR